MLTFVFILFPFMRAVVATSYVVDGVKGDDNNNGHNPSHAFRTIQHCVDSLASPGDSCNIRAGRYHEEVTVKALRGTDRHPYVIRGYNNERPIWDGTVLIQPDKWSFDEETKICSTSLDEHI